MPRFLVQLQPGVQSATAQATISSVRGVTEATPARTFNGLLVTADAGSKQEVADQPGVQRVYDDIQAVPQVADNDQVQDFLNRVRDIRGEEAPPLVETEPTDPNVQTDGGSVALPELANVEQFPQDANPQFGGVPDTLSLAGADTLHERGVTGNGVIMVVLDTGVARTQVEESRRMDGADLTDDGDDPWNPYHGHGTMSAGIAAGGQQTDGASPGFAPSTDVFPIKSSLSASEIIQAQDIIVQLQEDTGRPVVVNNSWGFTQCEGLCDHPVTKSIDSASNPPGVYQVHAAGNQGDKCGQGCDETGIAGPQSLNSGIAVAATGKDGYPESIMTYSSRGGRNASCGNAKPDVSAPIFGRVPWGDSSRNIGNGGGTSAAAPQVAGTVALLLSGTDQPPAQSSVFDNIRSTAQNFRGGDWDGCVGHGNLNAAEAAEIGLRSPISAGGFNREAAALIAGGIVTAALGSRLFD